MRYVSAEKLKSMSMEELCGEAFIFFVASYENVANLSTYFLHELLQNPEILNNLLEEINEVLARFEGNMSYEAIKEMKLLDRCIMGKIVLHILIIWILYKM